jgi:hypothetical protein
MAALGSLLTTALSTALEPGLEAYRWAKLKTPLGKVNLLPGTDIITGVRRALGEPIGAYREFPITYKDIADIQGWRKEGTVEGTQATPPPAYQTPTYTAPTPTPSFPSFEEQVAALRTGEKTRAQEFQTEEQKRIAAAYEPIFAELDRQVGLLPEQRAEFAGGVEQLVGTQRAGVETERMGGVRRLEAAGEEEKGRAKSTLRDLEQDIRNQLQARAIYFGSIGAAESSAPLMASEAITKAGLKARSGVLTARNQALNQIALKVQDVNDLASTQLQKIEQFKAEKLYEVSQWGINRLNELGTAKAQATGQQQQAINQAISNTQTDLTNRLRQLDDAVTTYRQSIDAWKMQRQADLEDWAKDIQMRAQYTSTTSPAYNQARQYFNTLFSTGRLDLGQARDATQAIYGIDPLGGLELTPEQERERKEPPTLVEAFGLSPLLGQQQLLEQQQSLGQQ